MASGDQREKQRRTEDGDESGGARTEPLDEPHRERQPAENPGGHDGEQKAQLSLCEAELELKVRQPRNKRACGKGHGKLNEENTMVRLHLGASALIAAGLKPGDPTHSWTFRQNGDWLGHPWSLDYRPPLLTAPVSMTQPPVISQWLAAVHSALPSGNSRSLHQREAAPNNIANRACGTGTKRLLWRATRSVH